MTDARVHIPQLSSDRLILRAPRRTDYAAYAAFFAGPRSHVAGVDGRKSWHLFATEMVGWCLDGFGHWIIERRDGDVLGVVGFSHPGYYPEPEMGWLLYDGHEGHGYATEAAGMARDWARSRLASLVSYIAPGNARSIAVAERLGAVHDAQASYPDGTGPDQVTIYRHWGTA